MDNFGERNIVTENANNKLVPFKNKITITDMGEDFNRSTGLQSAMVGKVQEYHDLKDITGKEVIKKEKGRSSVSTPLVRRQAEWRYPALSEPLNGTPNLFNVKPRTWESVEAARQHSILLNHQLNTEINRIEFTDEFVRRNVDDGFCILRTGWSFIEEEREFDVPTYDFYLADIDDVETINMITMAINLYNDSPKDFEKLDPSVKEAVFYTLEQNAGYSELLPEIYYAVPSGSTKKMIPVVIKNSPTVDIVDIRNFLIDPNCGNDIEKAMYCIYTFRSTISDLKAQGDLYSNLDLINTATQPNNPSSAADIDNPQEVSGENRDKITVTEYWGKWDVDGNGVLKPIVVTYVGDVIIRAEENPFPDKKYPFVISSYTPKVGSLFGEPDAPLIADNQRISGALTRGAIDIIGRSANAQTAVSKGALDAINRRKFENGDDFEYNPNMGNLENTIKMLLAPEVPNSLMGLLQQQSSVVESLTGIKSFGEGMNSGSLGDVATGIKGVLDASAKREVSILRRLASALSRVGAKWISMNKVYLSDQEVIRITNESNNSVSLEDNYTVVYRDQLQGSFDVSVDVTTAEEDNMKAQQISFMLQTLGNTIDFSITVQLLAQFAELRDMPDIAKQLREYQPQPDPMQEVEVQLKQAEVQKVLAEANLKNQQANYYSVLSSKGQLDTVEQDKGVKHAREVEKVEAQAKSQGALAEKQMELDLIKNAVENSMATKQLPKNPDVIKESSLLPEL